MKEKMRFVVGQERGVYTMSELCERHGISRKTGYKWLVRYAEDGVDCLRDRSRRPHSSPRRTPREIEELFIEARKAHRRWGPEKLLDVLGRRHPEMTLPAPLAVPPIVLLGAKVITTPVPLPRAAVPVTSVPI